MAITDTTSQINTIKNAYDKNVRLEWNNISHLRSELTWILPENLTTPSLSVTFDRYQPIVIDGGPIAENTDPDPFAAPDVEPITVVAAERGGYTVVNDKALLLSYDQGLMQSIVRRIRDAEAQVDDDLIETVLRSGNNAIVVKADKSVTKYSTGTTTYTATDAPAAAGGTLSSQAIRAAVVQLKKNKAPTVNGYYIAFADYQSIQDLRTEAGDTGWRTPANYDNSIELQTGEIGIFEKVRFIEANNLKVGSDGVHRTFVMGAQTLAANIVKDWEIVLTGTIPDPLDRRQPVGFKAMLGYGLFNPKGLVTVYAKTAYEG